MKKAEWLATFLLCGGLTIEIGCQQAKVNWPSTVACFKPSAALLSELSAILLTSSSVTQDLEAAAVKYGASSVICGINELANEWAPKQGIVAPNPQEELKKAKGRTLAINFLSTHGITVIQGED